MRKLIFKERSLTQTSIGIDVVSGNCTAEFEFRFGRGLETNNVNRRTVQLENRNSEENRVKVSKMCEDGKIW